VINDATSIAGRWDLWYTIPMQNKTLPTYFLLLLLAGSAILAFYILKPFLGPLVLATIFAVVLQPVFHKLTAFFGNRPLLRSRP
jgi:predicted PurR-regulated permease PerM